VPALQLSGHFTGIEGGLAAGRPVMPDRAFGGTKSDEFVTHMSSKPRVEITYCSQCRFVLRATWLTQELLMTFDTDLGEVALVPAGGGIFEVRLDGELIWSKKAQGRFPDSKDLKQLVRDRIAPDRDLGHSDR